MSTLPFDMPTIHRPSRPPVDNASTRAWRAAVTVLTTQGQMTERRARIFIGGIVKQGLRPEDLASIALAAEKAGTLEPASYITKAAHETLKRRKTAQVADLPSEARMRAWLAEFRENPASWRRDVRGPAPGEPGCVVPLAIRREYGAP